MYRMCSTWNFRQQSVNDSRCERAIFFFPKHREAPRTLGSQRSGVANCRCAVSKIPCFAFVYYFGSKYTLLVFQHFFVNSVFAKVAGGVGINHLGAEKFSIIPFLLAPLAQQTRIVAEVERRLSLVEELVS
jgi:hypothetical protein